MEFDTVVMAALLHDIGKLLVRVNSKSDKPNKEALKEKYPGLNTTFSVHALWGESFLKDNCHLFSDPCSVRSLSIYHGTKKKGFYYELIRVADGFSSSERNKLPQKYEEEYQQAVGRIPRSYVSCPLFSVFAQVELTRSRRFEGDRYDLSPLNIGDKSTFPRRDIEKLEKAYPRLSEQMEKDLLGPGTWKLPKLNFQDDVVTMYHILYKYTWCIASATFEEKRRYYPDISLFDHSVTTAAIASCLYLLDGERPDDGEFVVLRGDISNIQNFVYRVAQPQSIKGVSKRLRGRSFHVIVIAEAIARYLLKKAGLRVVNLLHCSGGEFEILLPNKKPIMDAVEEAMREIESDMFQQFHCELGITFAKEIFSRKVLENKEKRLEDFGLVLDRLNDRMARAKAEKFRRAMDSYGMERFTVPEEDKVLKIPTYCRACMVELTERATDEETSVCELCERQREIGGFLPRAGFIIFADVKLDMPEGFKDKAMSLFIPERLGSIWLVKDRDALKGLLQGNCDKEGSAEVYKINDTDDFVMMDMGMEDKQLKVSYGFWFLANSVPLAEEEFEHVEEETQKYKPGDILDFSDIAELSIGDSRLGILRMDVDSAGLIFSVGLDRSQDGTDKSISRIATMSRMLNLFFCGRLNKICRSASCHWWKNAPKEAPDTFKKYETKISRNIFYTVYSGGDDLFIIGPWSEIPHLAQRINQEFRDFTSVNPNITISSGMFLCKPKFPINRFAQLTRDELMKSKELEGNRMTMFGVSAVWQDDDSVADLQRLVDLGQDMYDALKAESPDNRLARAFLTDLIRMRRQFVMEDSIDPNFIPALIYQITRNVKVEARIEVGGRDESLMGYLKRRLISSADSWSTFEKVLIPATYALLKSRERR